MVKEFDFFLNRGDVKKQRPDYNTARAVFSEGIERLRFAKSLVNQAKSKYVLENAYEALREAADALLYAEGFKSYSHEASVVFLLRKGFNESDVSEFDRFRKIRNGIKYYGGDCDKTDASEAISLAERIMPKIRKMAKIKQD